MIAGELDILVPEISFEKIKKILSETLTEHSNSESTSKEENVYKQRNLRDYPWQRRVIEYKNQLLYPEITKYNLSEVYEIINLLPIVENTRNTIMIYQEKQSDYDFNFHYDGDQNYGFRIGYNLDINKVFVELARLKNEYSYVRASRKKIEDHMMDTSKIYQVIPSKSNTVLFLNGKNYPHRVPIVNHGERVVFIVTGELDYTKYGDISYLSILEE